MQVCVQLSIIKCQVSVQANQSSNVSMVPLPILVILHHHYGHHVILIIRDIA